MSKHTEAEALEVAHIVGLFNYFTRLADGFGLQPTEVQYST